MTSRNPSIDSFRTARRIARVSQSMLADHLGKSRALISGVERGNRELRVGELTSLASVFRLHPEAILNGQFQDAIATEAFSVAASFRRTGSLNDLSILDRWELSQAKQALESWQPPVGITPIEPFERRAPLILVVHQIRQLLNAKSLPVDVFQALYQHGILVIFTAMDALSGALLRSSHKPTRYCILINSDQPDDRLRWSALHELVHIVMNDQPQAQTHIDLFGPLRRQEDRVADQLAGEILLPTQELLPLLATHNTPEKIYEIADRARTSYAATVVRFGILGGLTATEVAERRKVKPTDMERKLKLKARRKAHDPFDIDTIMAELIPQLRANDELKNLWEQDFSPEGGPAILRRLQRAAVQHYVMNVPLDKRETSVNEVCEATARWLARKHPWS